MKIGFYGPYPTNHYLLHLHIEGSRLYAGILYPADFLTDEPDTRMAYADYLTWFKNAEVDYSYAGYPNNFTNGVFVRGVANQPAERWFEIKGKIAFDMQYAAGEDEFCDFSIIDLNIKNDGTFYGIQNRFSRTRGDKVLKSHRARAAIDVSTVLTVVFPFCAQSFEDAELIIVPYGEGFEPIGVEPDFRVSAKPPGERLIRDLYSPKFETPVVQVKPDDMVQIPFSTTWNGGSEYPHEEGEPIDRAITYEVEPTSGYVGIRRVTTDDQGNGVIRFRALDMLPGEKAKVKLNLGHFSALGAVEIEVVDA
ncbi:hypothetical protein TW86_04000 [Halomonas sp. S2151]|uniref:hypothetical protein n=1 Tax=Halomonas sp. S2151 TaxID=579478 RepID=UPI0005F9D2EC|nr:hypothetical protein [Halomonas sp. S2151]KJZ17424.1 hypothetical protein TW86_04000 [Halomonas sp. S2151]